MPGTADPASARSSGSDARPHTFANQLPLELRDAGENAKDLPTVADTESVPCVDWRQIERLARQKLEG